MSKTVTKTNAKVKTSELLVLVTGGSGFVAVHCILHLLNAGYQVRTTVRSLKREPDVRAMLKAGGIEPGDMLTFVEADLTADTNWPEAVAGCTYVLHVASPFPITEPEHEDELIVPAREGALRVLRASRDAGVKRVVLTSSFAAIGYGHTSSEARFKETDWTDLKAPHLSAYVKSKTIAERAAWDFIAREGGALELSVVNPVGIFGPVLGPDLSGSIQIIQMMMKGKMARVPYIYFACVDVRDVADLHLLAMTDPKARGERFLAAAGDSISMPDVALLLKEQMGDAAEKVSTKTLPNWLVRIAALFNKQAKQIVNEVGKKRMPDNWKSRQMLGWSPRSNKEAIVATAQSLVKLDLLKDAEA